MSSPDAVSSSDSIQPQHTSPNQGSLVEHLIAAKRSLASTGEVYRANELVAQAKTHVERISVTTARNKFTRHAIQRQLWIVTSAQKALIKVKGRVNAEFKQVLTKLDAADAAVNDALAQLSETHIDTSLQRRPSPNSATHATDDDKQKLSDFVDLKQLEAIRAYFRQCIDVVNASNEEIADVLENLEDCIRNVANALDPQDGPAFIKLSNSGIAQTYGMLDDIASDMAESLQSLIKHYDLCVKAVRNTEGAGEAVAAKLDESDRALEQSQSEPQISDAERAELLLVIQGDADEVDAVVTEIRNLATEMNTQAEQLDEHLKALLAESTNITNATRALDALSPVLASCSQAGTTFVASWAQQLTNIEEKLPELEAANQAFRGYLEGYRRMISELKRRRKFQASIAMLYDEETHARQSFLDEWGHSLPVDFLPLLHGDPQDPMRGFTD